MSTRKRKRAHRRKKEEKNSGLTRATADPNRLYELSVQDTETLIEIIEDTFKNRGRKLPLSLREDFCGTANLCAEWVKSSPHRTAVGLDIDAETLAWAEEHNISSLGTEANRVELFERDVLLGTQSSCDVIVAFNFSYWIFHEREMLRKYFLKVLEGLSPGGAFLLDLYGGPDAQYTLEETTEQDGFDYIWEQETFDPITNRTKCHIHFEFPDGTKLNRAFSYDWRLWNLPDLVDLLREVGFQTVDTWWDGTDDILRPTKTTENLISWVAYLAAFR